MKSLPIGAALAALLIATPVVDVRAQEQAPATQETAAVDTQTFLETVISSNLFEIRSSELARDTASSGDVHAFARQMIADHTAMNREFLEVLERSSADRPLYELEMLPRHQEVLQWMGGFGGREFETAYIEAQVDLHQEAVDLFEAYARSGEDEVLAAFARDTLPVLRQHTEQIEAISRSKTI